MSGYVESYRGQVLMRECDLLGHMNIQFYTARVSLGMSNMIYLIGMVREDLQGSRRGLAAIQQENRYLAELKAGDIIHMESAVVGCSNKTVTLNHRLFNSADGTLAFTNRTTSVYMDLDSRKAVPLSDAMREKVREMMVEGEDAA